MEFVITSQASTKLWAFIESLKTEVGGFGMARYDADEGVVTWEDVFLVPQFVSGSEVEFEGDALFTAIEKFGSLLDEPNFIPVSWHSHHTMGAFWSGTDEECIRTYADAGMHKLLSFVGCHDHKYRLRMDFFGVEHCGVKIPQVTMDQQSLMLDGSDPAYSAIFDEIDANLKKKPAPAPKVITNTQHRQPPQTERVQTNLNKAFEIREIMDELGCSRSTAEQIIAAQDEYEGVGPMIRFDDLTHDFDHQATGGAR